MAAVDDLIAELQAQHEPELEGEFTLDADKAREKMRQFQLADPHRYVLLLVQAAVLGGCTRIDFEIDSDDMHARFDGRRFTPDELRDLHVFLFGGGSHAADRCRQELALAVNAAMALNPRFVRIESGEEGGGVVAVLQPGAEDLVETVSSLPFSGTHVHVKDRFRPGLLVDFVRDLRGSITEERILRQHCHFAEVTVTLDGDRISWGPRIFEECFVTEAMDEQGSVRGVVGLALSGGPPARLDLVHCGVWIGSRELDGFPRGFLAVADAQHLKKDVSQADVIRDEAYEAMLEALRSTFDGCLLQLCRGLLGEPGAAESSVPTSLEACPPWLRTVLSRRLAELGLEPEDGRGERESARALRQVLMALPFWRTTADEPVSTRALASRAVVGGVGRQAYEPEPSGFNDDLRVLDGADWLCLRDLFGARLVDHTDEYQASFERERAREKFEKRRRAADLGDEKLLCRLPIKHRDFRGEVGVRGHGPSTIFVMLEGCLLVPVVVRSCAVPGLMAVIEGPFQPVSRFDNVVPDHTLAAAMDVLLEAAHRCMEQLAEKARSPGAVDRPFWTGYALATLRGRLEHQLRTVVGLEDGPRGTGKIKRPRTPLHPLPSPHPFRCERWYEHALAELPLFDTADGRVLSLGEIEDGRPSEPIRVVSQDLPPLEGIDELVLRVSGAQLELLRARFGTSRVDRFDREYRRMLEDQSWLSRPKSRFAIDRVALAEIPVGSEAIVGVRQTSPGQGRDAMTAKVDVFVCGREAGTAELPCELPGMVFALAFHDVRMRSFSEKNAKRRKRIEQRMGEALQAWVGGICRAAIDDGRALEAPARLALLTAIAVTIGDPTWLPVYLDLLSERSPEAAARMLLALRQAEREGPGPSGLSQLQALLDQQDPHTEKTLAAEAARSGELWVRLAPLLDGLVRVPLIQTREQPVTVAGLVAAVRRDGAIAWLTTAEAVALEGGPQRLFAVVDDDREVEMLQRLFGKTRVVPGQEIIAQWRQEQEFEKREPLESLRLDPADVVVAVDVDDPTGRGQLGISRRRPGVARSSVTMCYRRRPIGTVCAALVWEPVGILDGAFGRESQFSEVSRADREVLDALARHVEQPLFEALTRHVREDPDDEVAREWVIHVLASRARSAAPDSAQNAAVLWGAPVFEGLHAPRLSLQDLADAEPGDEGPWVLPSGSSAGAAVQGGPPVVQLRSPTELDVLRNAFGRTRNWLEHLQVQRRKAEAPERPRCPEDALQTVKVNGRGLHGQLWLYRQFDPDATIALCREGKVVDSVALFDELPCGGAVWGSGVRVSDDFTQAELKQRQREYLFKRVAKMIRHLIALEEDCRGGTVDLAASEHEAVRATLLAVALRLIERRRHERLEPRELRRLHHELLDLPLLPLDSGRYASFRVARRERPPQLRPFWIHDVEHPELPSEARGGSIDEPEPELPSEARGGSIDGPEPELPSEARGGSIDGPDPEPDPSPQELLLDAVRNELRLIRGRNEAKLDDAYLTGLKCWPADGGGEVLARYLGGELHINERHPAAERALADHAADPMLVSVLASSVFTALNVWSKDVSDGDEAVFHRLHVEHLLTARSKS